MSEILQRLLCSPDDPAQSLLMGHLSHLHYNCFLRDLPLDSSVLPGLEKSFRKKVFYRLQGITFLAYFLLYIPHIRVHGEGSSMLPWGWSQEDQGAFQLQEREMGGTLWVPYTEISKQTQALNVCLWLRCWFGFTLVHFKGNMI